MRGTLMRLLTKDQHVVILTKYDDNTEAAKAYTKKMKQDVSPQNVRYWRTIFIVNEGNMAKTDRILKQDRKLRPADPDQDIGVLPDLDKVYHCILHIPDQHAPYAHPDALDFLAAVKAAFPVDLVVNAGDEADGHAISFHDSDPNLDSAGVELEKAKAWLSDLAFIFPEQLVCSSNHGSLVYRKAKVHGIPAQMIKSYRDILFPGGKAKRWSWADSWIVQTPLGPVMFRHSSSNPLGDAAHSRCNLMVGHAHTKLEVQYTESTDFMYWGATGGCLIDRDSPAFAYATGAKKAAIGCTVILEGRPMIIPMIRDQNNRWIGRL